MAIDQSILYALCPCQSGKKFKFCCWPKYRDYIDPEMSMSDVVGVVRRCEAGVADLMGNDEACSLCDKGVEALKTGAFARAADLLRRAREIDETLWTAWNNGAMCAWESGGVETAYDLQRKGIEKSLIENTFGYAAMAIYAHALGRDEEAVKWVDRAASNKKPLDRTCVLHVCKALAVFRRHQDIIDYVTASGMSDDADIAYFLGTAYANVGDTDAALSALYAARDGRYRTEAGLYIHFMNDNGEPYSPYCGDWPYFTPMDFAPARWLDEDMDDGVDDPFARCRNFADEAVVTLCARYCRTPEALLHVVEGRVGERFEKLREGLERLAKLKREMEEEIDGEEQDEAEVDDCGDDDEDDGTVRQRLPMRTRFDVVQERDRLSDEERDLLSEALHLLGECKDEPSEEFLLFENGMATLDAKQMDSFIVKLTYLEMVHKHDPERALGTLRNFYARNADDAFVAGALLGWLCEDSIEEAVEIADRFRLPTLDAFRDETGIMMFTRWIAPLLILRNSQVVAERFPEKLAHIQAMAEASLAIMHHFADKEKGVGKGKKR